MIPRLWRFVRRLILVVLAFALTFPVLYSLVVREQHGTAPAMPEPSPGKYRVFVADWGYHTSILVEQPRGWKLGPPGKERATFLEYSWGDRMFYMQADYLPHALFATLVLPTETVAYLDGSSDPPSFGGARAVYARTIDATTVHTLLVELEGTFKRASDGTRLAPYPAVSGYAGRFYPAYGRYLWTRDCNWWTVTRLATAHLANAATGTLFSGQVAGRLRGFRRAPAPASRSS